MGETAHTLIKNYVLAATVIAWFVAQILKFIINYAKTKELNIERLIGAGGMPSAHSALVSALTVAMSRKFGISSPEFALSLVLASVVIYDAMGVRRAAGDQARILNKMITRFDIIINNIDQNIDPAIRSSLNENEKELKEFLGHTPLEVLGGVLLGIVIAVLIPLF